MHLTTAALTAACLLSGLFLPSVSMLVSVHHGGVEELLTKGAWTDYPNPLLTICRTCEGLLAELCFLLALRLAASFART